MRRSALSLALQARESRMPSVAKLSVLCEVWIMQKIRGEAGTEGALEGRLFRSALLEELAVAAEMLADVQPISRWR